MDLGIIVSIISIVIPVCSAIIMYVIRGINARLDLVEHKATNAKSDIEVRQIVADKFDPIKDDLGEIRADIKEIRSTMLAVLTTQKTQEFNLHSKKR